MNERRTGDQPDKFLQTLTQDTSKEGRACPLRESEALELSTDTVLKVACEGHPVCCEITVHALLAVGLGSKDHTEE